MRCWLALLLVACGTLRKPPEPDRRLDVRTSGGVFESDTGYRFAALPESDSGVIRVSVRYPVGSADDPAGKEGLAHLVEHLLYEVEVDRNGTKTSIGAELGRIAMWSNAETRADSTTYDALILPDALDALVQLEVERITVGCAGIKPETFAREREVVLNELRQRQGARGADLQRQIHEALYPAGHPYRAVSSVESVSKLTLADVCGFLVGPYRRGKAIVIASGAVDVQALQTAAGHHLARAPKRNVTAAPPAPRVVTPQPGTVKLRGDVEQPLLLVTWPLPPRGSQEYRMLQMATGAIPVRLGAFGLTYGWGHSTFATTYGGAHAPVLAVGVTLKSTGDLDEAKSSARKSAEYAARSIARTGDDRDTDNWKEHWQARAESVLGQWESLDARNDFFADAMQFEAGDNYLIGRIDELVKAHPQQVHDLVEKWLSPSRARYLLIEPSQPGVATRTTTYTGGAEAHATFVDASLADKPLPAPPARATLRTERFKTANGISVILWPHGTAPLVHGRLIIDSGYAHEPKGKEGIAAFAGADDIDEDGMVFYGRELATRVDDLVARLGGELRFPGYDVSDEVKGVMRGKLKLQRAKERTQYRSKYLAALYGRHPYAREAMTEDSLGHISQDAVMSWARSHVVPANSALVIAGKLDPALVKKHIAYNTDQISSGSNSSPVVDAPNTTHSFIMGVTEQPSPTVEIDVGFVRGAGVDRDHAKRLVLEAVLGSQLDQLRAKRAVTYGFSASYSPRRAGGLWSISGEVDASRAEEAATMIATILDQMRADPETYRTAFVLARQRVLESLLVSTTSSGAVVEQLVELARYDLPDNFYDLTARTVASLTLADFHPFLARELAVEGQVFGAFGNRDVVAATLAAAEAVKPASSSRLVDPFQ